LPSVRPVRRVAELESLGIMSTPSHQEFAKPGVLLLSIATGILSLAIPIIVSLIVVVHRSMPDRGPLFRQALLWNLSAIIVGFVSLAGLRKSGRRSIMWLPWSGVALSGFCAAVALLLYMLVTIRWIC
jgi:hypothetical protein